MAPLFAGIWPILYAFFTPADSLDRTLMRRQAVTIFGANPRGTERGGRPRRRQRRGAGDPAAAA